MALQRLLDERHLTLVFPDFNILITESIARQFETLVDCLDVDPNNDKIEIPFAIDQSVVDDLFRWCLIHHLNPLNLNTVIFDSNYPQPIIVMLKAIKLIEFLHHSDFIDWLSVQRYRQEDFAEQPILGRFVRRHFLNNLAKFGGALITHSDLADLARYIVFLPDYVDLIRLHFIKLISTYVSPHKIETRSYHSSLHQFGYVFSRSRFPNIDLIKSDERIMTAWSKIYNINLLLQKDHVTLAVGDSKIIIDDKGFLVGDHGESTEKYFFNVYSIEDCTLIVK